jgi:hypothetical protein
LDIRLGWNSVKVFLKTEKSSLSSLTVGSWFESFDYLGEANTTQLIVSPTTIERTKIVFIFILICKSNQNPAVEFRPRVDRLKAVFEKMSKLDSRTNYADYTSKPFSIYQSAAIFRKCLFLTTLYQSRQNLILSEYYRNREAAFEIRLLHQNLHLTKSISFASGVFPKRRSTALTRS